MNNGLKILIERMREFPDDFDDRSYKVRNNGSGWISCVHEAKDLCEKGALPEEDAEALTAAIKTLAVKLFEGRVLEALNPPAPPEVNQYREAMRIDSSNNLGIDTQRAVGMNAALGSGYGIASNPAIHQLKIGSAGLSESDIHTIKKQAGPK